MSEHDEGMATDLAHDDEQDPCETGGEQDPEIAYYTDGRPPLKQRIMRAMWFHKWPFLVAQAYEQEVRARQAVCRYQREMAIRESATEHAKGLATRDDLEAMWNEAEDLNEGGKAKRKSLMRDFVSFKRTHIRTQDGRKQEVYAAMAARYWVGERGASDLIAASGFLYQPVLIEDQEEVQADVVQNFRVQVAGAMQQKYGLEVLPASEDLDRIETLFLWEVDDTTVDRIRSYEQGWGVRPKGLDKPASQLTARDIRRLVAMQGHKMKPFGTPLAEDGRTLVDTAQANEGTTLVDVGGHPLRVTHEQAADVIEAGEAKEWKEV